MILPGSPGIHQFVPRLEPHDATGNHTLLLQRALRAAGWSSEIFVHESLDNTVAATHELGRFDEWATGSDVLVYQLSTASPLAEFLMERPESLIVDFHNLTPPRLYQSWDPSIAAGIETAQRQVRRLARRATLGIADSSFNAAGFAEAGCRRTEVVPVLFDPHRGADGVNETVLSTLLTAGQTGTQWLFVGRIVPPKAQHRLVMALWVYRQLYDPEARLHLVGSGGHEIYLGALRHLVEELELSDAVAFASGADDVTLAAYYRGCDVFVSLSEHEGFGIPLVEAMAARLPVVTLGAGAVPETVGSGALVLREDEPTATAAAVHRVMVDGELRERLRAAGQARSQRFELARTSWHAVDTLQRVVAGTAGAGSAL